MRRILEELKDRFYENKEVAVVSGIAIIVAVSMLIGFISVGIKLNELDEQVTYLHMQQEDRINELNNQYINEVTALKAEIKCLETKVESEENEEVTEQAAEENPIPENAEEIDYSDIAKLCHLKDSTEYALFVKGQKVASVDIGKTLDFSIPDLVISEDGKLYKMLYTSKPWSMKLLEVVKGATEPDYGFDNYPDYLNTYCKNGVRYVIMPEKEETLDLENIPNDEDVAYNLDTVKYNSIKCVYANYDKIHYSYGSDAMSFELDYGFIRDGRFFEERSFNTGIKRNYLTEIIPTEELDKLAGDVSADEVEKQRDTINTFLKNWEESHAEEIAREIKKDPFILEENDRMTKPGADWGAKAWADAHQDLLK